MSWLPVPEPECVDPARPGAVDVVVEASSKDLGGFRVRRALPSDRRRMVGPFVFLDHMGPALFPVGQGIDVRPHPHIGLATVTWLTDGSLYHRDSLGSRQPIAPGAVNWMTAGRGIVHSERTAPEERAAPHHIEGLQCWVALPFAHEETEPGFAHHDAAELPAVEDKGVSLRLIAGEVYGKRSPVRVFSEMFFADARLDPGAVLPLPDQQVERAAYLLDGEMEIAGEVFGPHRLLVFRPGDRLALRATRPSRLVILGGEPLEGPRHVWWNFVSSSKDRIEAAKADWVAGRFARVPGETEFIPLPA
jgi:redox-sensitive bicupin YhaK (pirin superfamily)